MKVCVLALAAVSLLAVPVFAQSIGEKTGINAMTGSAPKTEDFVKMVAISDMFEVESSKLAQANAQDAKVKTFAAKMVKDHTETSNELKGLVSSGKVKMELPATLDSSHQSKLDKLKGLKAADLTINMSAINNRHTRTRCRCSSVIQRAAIMRIS